MYPAALAEDLDRLGGRIFSERVLRARTQAGMSREDAYAAVQRNAMEAWKKRGDFRGLLEADADVAKHLDGDALGALFDLGGHTRHVDMIFARVFGE